ncbi:hypothetical protein [Paenibacillus sp. H1-7]|nr:hypothetical protein [Paenibacillus sp. H1-7]
MELRLAMMNKHKQAVLSEISLMTESLKGIDFKIDRYSNRIQETKD